MILIERIVAICCRWPWAVIAISLLLAVGAGYYTHANFAMNTDSSSSLTPRWAGACARRGSMPPSRSRPT
jgi:uncharacterized membrane protein YdfJ with MMPL/SSD domain